MSGPLASWLLAHLPAEATRTDRLVGTILALDANHDGSGADQTRDQMAELAGASPSAVSRSLRRLVAWRFLAAGPEQPGRQRPRMRMILVRWCPPEAGCQPCAQLAPWYRKVATNDNPSAGKVVTSAPKGGHQWQPLRNERGALTGQQLAAKRWAQQSAPRYMAPPGSGGRSRPAPWNPPTARPEAGRVRPNPSGQGFAVVREDDPAEPEWQGQQAWNGAGMATLLPVPADRASRPAAAGGTA
jgi:hypothetical protein